MTETTPTETAQTELNPNEMLSTLKDVMTSSESDTSRIAAAKILLERFAPKKSDEEQKQQAIERNHALTEARGLLAEFAAFKLASFRATRALGDAGATATDNPNG